MLGSVLPFSPELADRVSEYCEAHSEGLIHQNPPQYYQSVVRLRVDTVTNNFNTGHSASFRP